MSEFLSPNDFSIRKKRQRLEIIGKDFARKRKWHWFYLPEISKLI